MSFHIQNIYRHFGYGITYMSTATPYPVYIYLIPYPKYIHIYRLGYSISSLYVCHSISKISIDILDMEWHIYRHLSTATHCTFWIWNNIYIDRVLNIEFWVLSFEWVIHIGTSIHIYMYIYIERVLNSVEYVWNYIHVQRVLNTGFSVRDTNWYFHV